jgi:hypothetical protein
VARQAAAQEAAAMRGRRPSGPEYVEALEGSALARQRLRVVLETLAGRCRVTEACERLGICEQRFHQIREEALQAAVAALEPRPAGRPSAAASEPAPPQALQQQLEQLQVQLQASRLREEIALTLPQQAATSPAATEPEKKTRRRQKKERAPPGGYPAKPST